MKKLEKVLIFSISFLAILFFGAGLVSAEETNSVNTDDEENLKVISTYEDAPIENSTYTQEDFLTEVKNSGDESLKKAVDNNSYYFTEDGSLVINLPTEKNGQIQPNCIACVNHQIILSKVGSQYTYYGNWITGVTGEGKARLTLSKTVGWSNGYSGSLSTSVSALSSTAGFSVTRSGSTTASYSVSVPSNKTYAIQYRKVYKRQKIKQTRKLGGKVVGTNYIYANNYRHLAYRSVER
ncbi:hypothetical protein GLV94_02855 [Virgibacillus halodenitrificans]|uniref:hypothetical protein n=1 Tax=Virgibacillus halodenitrificans TaxID=1482 RepID=UPI00136DB966|nr:hypothetical protein [Virgibacillus halodenitrificans]MYL44573.1 hypothetical protein [Virgibacillus halodenitrificans]